MPPWLPASPFWELAYWFNLNALLARPILGPKLGFQLQKKAMVLGRVRLDRSSSAKSTLVRIELFSRFQLFIRCRVADLTYHSIPKMASLPTGNLCLQR